MYAGVDNGCLVWFCLSSTRNFSISCFHQILPVVYVVGRWIWNACTLETFPVAKTAALCTHGTLRPFSENRYSKYSILLVQVWSTQFRIWYDDNSSNVVISSFPKLRIELQVRPIQDTLIPTPTHDVNKLGVPRVGINQTAVALCAARGVRWNETTPLRTRWDSHLAKIWHTRKKVLYDISYNARPFFLNAIVRQQWCECSIQQKGNKITVQLYLV